MASELLVKRLLTQASVSVLAGLLMSSAVLAEDISGPGDESGISVDAGEDGGPSISIDPVDPGIGIDDGGFVPGDEGPDAGSDDPSRENNPVGEEGSNYRGGDDDGISVDVDWSGNDDGVTDDGATDEGATDGESDDYGSDDEGTIDGEVAIDPVCGDCEAVFDVTVMNMGAPETRDTSVGGAGGKDFGRSNDQGHGAGRDGDLGGQIRRLVK